LEDGEIVERGTHEELLEATGVTGNSTTSNTSLSATSFINPGEDFTPEPEALRAKPRRVFRICERNW
jgi:hypothetical protein